MPNKKGQKEVVNNADIKELSEIEENDKIEARKRFDEEKVEVLIKEVVRIKPADFSAFKHALEEFVDNWDK